jgi:hypothetical protein
MPSMWEAFGDVVGGTFVGPVILAGAVVSVAGSPEVRKRLREWGVRGAATALSAADLAARRVKTAAGSTNGIVSQISRRVVEAAAEIREEWEDLVAEVQAEKERREQQPSDTRGSTANRAGGDAASRGKGATAAEDGNGDTSSRGPRHGPRTGSRRPSRSRRAPA